jgi:hypothetical protein
MLLAVAISSGFPLGAVMPDGGGVGGEMMVYMKTRRERAKLDRSPSVNDNGA